MQSMLSKRYGLRSAVKGFSLRQSNNGNYK